MSCCWLWFQESRDYKAVISSKAQSREQDRDLFGLPHKVRSVLLYSVALCALFFLSGL